MALLVRGRSRCPICRETILEGEEVYLFPHIFGPDHPAHVLSDAAAHRRCVDAADFGHQALAALEDISRGKDG